MPGTILLHADEDEAFALRLDCAIDLAARLSAHIRVAAVETAAVIAADPLGGAWVATAIAAESEALAELRAATEARLMRAGVAWDWVQPAGDTASELVRLGDLADLAVVGRSFGARRVQPIVDAVAVEMRCPLLSIAAGGRALDVERGALVAWNGSPEAAHALRAALPLLRLAAGVVVAELGDTDGLPGTAAAEWLSRHDIHADLLQRPSTDPEADLLALAESGLHGFVVMGAYGHSRLRQAILGGVTRSMLGRSPIPLLTTH